MAEYGMFKTSMRGFRKEDVLAFIDELMTEKTKEAEAFAAQIAKLESELAEAKVQQAAVEENERLTGEVATLREQVAELTAKLEEVQGASDAASARDAELTAELEQSHQAISALWEEKAGLQNRLEKTQAVFSQLREVGEEFCRQVTALLPAEEPVETATESAAEAVPVVAITEEPLVITEEPRPADQSMERWLF